MIWAIYVRFTPESGHVRCNQGCPLWANSESKIKLPSPEDRRERIQMLQHFLRQENRAFGFHARNRRVDISRRGKYQLFHHVDLIAKAEKAKA